MNATFVQKGSTLYYTPTEDVAFGQVVALAARVGVAGTNIASGETGTLHMEGVFQMEKATGAVDMGALLYYDETNETITTAASDDSDEDNVIYHVPAGYAAAPADSADTTVLVKLLG